MRKWLAGRLDRLAGRLDPSRATEIRWQPPRWENTITPEMVADLKRSVAQRGYLFGSR